LRRELDKAQQCLATTEAALTIMGKAHEILMNTYRELVAVDVPTRAATL